MITRIGLVDGLTPAVAAWLKDMNPAAGRALLKAARVIRRAAVRNIDATFKRTGSYRTSFRTFSSKRTGRMRVKLPTRGIRIKLEPSASIQSVRVWHGSGILAAHELGSTIPPVTIRPWSKRVLGWGGAPGGPHPAHAAFVSRRAFTLPRRPTLLPAYEANQSAVLTLLEAEYQKVLNVAPPELRT